jgi:hypothetical protein
MKRALITMAFSFLAIWMLKAQKMITSVPFEKFGDHIFIKVSLDDSEPLDFIFDTGDATTVIDLGTAKNLGLNLDKKVISKGAEGSITGSLIKHNYFTINDFLIEKDIEVYATDLGQLGRKIGRNVDGIIGDDILIHHGVHLNYDRELMEIYEPGQVPQVGEAISFESYNGAPKITTRFTLNDGTTMEGDFLVNTGAGTTVDFTSPYAKKNKLIKKTGRHFTYTVVGVEGKESDHFEGRVQSFELAGEKLNDFPIGISEAKEGILADKRIAGIIGGRTLSKFNISIDYENNKLYLNSNQSFEDEATINASGLILELGPDMESIVVHRVIADSPAEEAGFKVGEKILAIDDTSLNLADVRARLEKSGEYLTVTVQDLQGNKRKISFVLKSLI